MFLFVVAKEAYAKAEEETTKDEGQVIKIYILMLIVERQVIKINVLMLNFVFQVYLCY